MVAIHDFLEYILVDWEIIKDRVLRFYFSDTENVWGDDWDDIPFEHNAGVVYERFIRAILDVYLPFHVTVKQIQDDYVNSPYSKEDLFKACEDGKLPVIVSIINEDDTKVDFTMKLTLAQVLTKVRYYFYVLKVINKPAFFEYTK